MSEHFTIDPDAHAQAKLTGEYGTENPDAPKQEETPEEGEKEFVPPMTDPDNPEPEEDEEGTDDESDEEESEDSANDFTSRAQQWTQEFMEHGALSEESQKDVLESVFKDDVPEEMKLEYMKTFTAGLDALRTAAANEQFAIVGGVDQYQDMLEWGAKNLSAEEIEVFDAEVTADDMGKRAAAIKGLYARMQLATGGKPDFEPDLSHSAGRHGGEPIIGSRQELMQIQRTDRYKKDPAYRELVARQLKQSMETGNYIA